MNIFFKILEFSLSKRNMNIDQISESCIRDIFHAYGLSLTGLNHEERLFLLTQISNIKRTFPYLLEVILSNRHPRTIMLLSSKLGMYIPPRTRIGLFSYEFYLNNVKYYEMVLERRNSIIKNPTIYDIFMAKDRISLLMKYRDEEFLRPEFTIPRDYADRRSMIETFISNNITIHGEFKLISNSRSCYSSKTQGIIYNDDKTKLSYSTDELIQLFDLQHGILWKGHKNFTGDPYFSRLSLHHLRQKILEKLGQWRNRDKCESSGELHRILVFLDSILINEIRNDTNAYLGNPQFLSQ